MFRALSAIALLVLPFSCAQIFRADEKTAGIFSTKCAGCHGASGRGDSPAGKNMGAPDFTKTTTAKNAADLQAVIEKGKNKMPAYGKSLTAGEIAGLAAYIKSMK